MLLALELEVDGAVEGFVALAAEKDEIVVGVLWVVCEEDWLWRWAASWAWALCQRAWEVSGGVTYVTRVGLPRLAGCSALRKNSRVASRQSSSLRFWLCARGTLPPPGFEKLVTYVTPPSTNDSDSCRPLCCLVCQSPSLEAARLRAACGDWHTRQHSGWHEPFALRRSREPALCNPAHG